MEDRMNVDQLKEALPDLPDDDLLQMKKDIETNPDAFAEHVGLNGAAEFLTALLLELNDRKLVDLDDPKGERTDSSLRRSSVQNLLSGHLREAGANLPPLQEPTGNRKQRRAQAAKVRKIKRSLRKS